MIHIPLVTFACALAASVVSQRVQVDANAFNDTTQLNPPPLPNPLPPLSFDIPSASTPTGLGVVQDSLLGFSLEMSVSESLFGKSKSELNPIFVRLLSHVAKRAGHVKIRVGGNSQEGSVIVEPNTINGLVQKEEDANTVNPTDTPNIMVSRDIIDMMSQISTQTNAGWYVGIPFNDTNFRLRVAELAQQTLGDNLLGMQLGNEPDLYGRHRRRDPATWTTQKYFEEFGWGVQAIRDNPNISAKNKIVGPSIAITEWTPEQLWETGYIEAYKHSIGTLAVERYPGSNCGAIKGLGKIIDPQEEIVVQMTHKSAQSYVAPYHNTAALALQAGKPFVVMEFNTGTCSGFPGLSNAFGAALWIVDASLQMAHSNFSGAMLHVGGQNAFYNPFTPPPGALIRSHGWTVGPPYYAHLVVGEAIGSTNRSRVIDLSTNGGNEYTPAYGIYEDGTPEAQRVVLLNFMTDGSGRADYTASVAVPADRESVKVKYLLADSTAARSNFTWAGQTFGGVMESDGRLKGDVRIETIACNDGKCPIKVPAPAVAVVFLSDNALLVSDPEGLAASAATANAGTNQSDTESDRGSENAAASQYYSTCIQLVLIPSLILILSVSSAF